MDAAPQTTSDLRDLLRPVWAHKVLIVVVVVIATAATYVITNLKTKQYRASTQIFLKQSSAAEESLATGVQVATDRSTENQARLLKSSATAVAVAKKINFSGPPSVLLDKIDVAAVAGSDFITITSKSADPVQAAKLANAFAQAFVTAGSTSTARNLVASLRSLYLQQRRVPKTQVNVVARAQLADQIRRIRTAQSLPTASAQQLDKAGVPGRPFSPKPKRDALFAFAMALFLAIAIAVGLDRVDRRLRKPEDLEVAYGAPVLTVVPHADDIGQTAEGISSLGRHVREPFRTLRAGIKLASVDKPIQVILVTSAAPGEGKSTVVRNLALAYAEMGLKVIAVELDLRRPSLGKLFDVERDRGVTDYLAGESKLGDVLLHPPTRIPEVDEHEVDGHPAVTPASSNGHVPGGVSLLLRGGQVPNPAGILASDSVRAMINLLRQDFDIIIVDTAPVGAVSDTVPLLSAADGLLLVGRLSYTTRDDVRRLRGLLDRAKSDNVIGVVANDLTAFEAGAIYGRGYGYGYSYDYDSDDAPQPAGKA